MRAQNRLIVAILLSIGSERQEFSWAFAQELDNSFHPNEVCREPLAQSLYAPTNKAKTAREGESNIFLFTGSVQTYRIYADRAQNQCETALTNMRLRQRL